MRDPNRLYVFYDYLKSIHMTGFPDLRFGQLFSNFMYWLASEKKIDIFYLEETSLIQYLDEFAEKCGVKYDAN